MDRVQELLQYMHQLMNIASEYPQIDFTERVERVCNEIEKELNVSKSTNIGEFTVTLDAKELVKNLQQEIKEIESRKASF
jgi:hypothetical protein